MEIKIQNGEGISQAIKRKLINGYSVTANNENFSKASIWTKVMNTFQADGANSTISHNGKTKSIGSEWDTLKKNVIVYTGNVIKIATATWKKILEIFGVKEQTPDGGDSTVVKGNGQGEGSLNAEDDGNVQGSKEKVEERGTVSVVEEFQGDPAGNVSQNLSTSSVEELPAKTPSIVQVPVTPVTEEKDAVSADSDPVVDPKGIVDKAEYDNTISLPDDDTKISYTVQEGGEIDYNDNITNLQNNDTYKAFMDGFAWATRMPKDTLTFRGITKEYTLATWPEKESDFGSIATEDGA